MNPRAQSLMIASGVLALDRATKVLIERSVPLYDSFHVIPGFFDIVHTKNPGAAFGIFADNDHPLRAFFLIGISLVVLVFVAWMVLKPDKQGAQNTRLTMFGLALVLGGAMGNMYDRVMFGMVTDFLEFYLGQYRFAAFNIADSGITIGAGLLILDMWRTRNKGNAPETY